MIPTETPGDTPRARRFRQFLAVAVNVLVWSGVAATALWNRKTPRFLSASRPHGSQTFAAQQERWSSAYPTAEDFADDDETSIYGNTLPAPAPQFDHQPHG